MGFKIFFIVLTIVLIVVVAILYFLGKKLEKRQAEQQQQIEASKQNVTMLIIDKRKMKLKEAGLPPIVVEQTPRLLRGSKVAIVKAKIGPKIMTLICDEKIFDLVPVKKEVKAVISGIYITSVKGIRGPLEAPAKRLKFWEKVKSRFPKKSNK